MVKVLTKTSHGSLMKIGIVWGTRDGDPLGGIVLTCRDETSCSVLVHYSRSYRGGQKDLLHHHTQRKRKMRILDITICGDG